MSDDDVPPMRGFWMYLRWPPGETIACIGAISTALLTWGCIHSGPVRAAQHAAFLYSSFAILWVVYRFFVAWVNSPSRGRLSTVFKALARFFLIGK